jgi:diaminopimelate decarboxylase
MRTALPFTLASIHDISREYPTPFHLYDETRLRDNAARLRETMQTAGVKGFRNYFAVKALPNPAILRILAEEGMGADCSSLAELRIAEMAGLTGEDIMFSSNNTSDDEFKEAHRLGAIINFDDESLVAPYLEHIGVPTVACGRLNPGDLSFGGMNESIIGSPREAKYGMPIEHLKRSFTVLKQAGVSRFGLHTMLLSNELDWQHHETIARRLFEAANEISNECDIRFEFINLGGGIGVPYRPEEHEFDLAAFAEALVSLYKEYDLEQIGSPRIVMENGRYVSADCGYLITEVTTIKRTHKTYVGIDASMSDLMRPGMYDAYHHISVLTERGKEIETVDVVGSLCENNDKFAINRELPRLAIGDIIVIHTTGAHGHAMGFQYNGKLRHAELLLTRDGDIQQIRRAETLDDYFATLPKGDQ